MVRIRNQKNNRDKCILRFPVQTGSLLLLTQFYLDCPPWPSTHGPWPNLPRLKVSLFQQDFYSHSQVRPSFPSWTSEQLHSNLDSGYLCTRLFSPVTSVTKSMGISWWFGSAQVAYDWQQTIHSLLNLPWFLRQPHSLAIPPALLYACLGLPWCLHVFFSSLLPSNVEVPQGTILGPRVSFLYASLVKTSQPFSRTVTILNSQTCASSPPASWTPDPGTQLPPVPIYFDVPQVRHTFM